MSKLLLTFLLILFFTLPLFAQSVDTAWVRRYNGSVNSTDSATAIVVDDSGNVYVTGTSYDSITGYDYVTIRYYPTGDTCWQRRYNGPGNGQDVALDIVLDVNGNIYVTGYSWDSGTGYDYATIKFYPNGDTAWVRRFNGVRSYTYAYALAIDNLGNVYVTGTDEIAGITIKYDQYGNLLWTRTEYPGSNGSARLYAIDLDDSNNVYVAGEYSYRGYECFLTLKYSSDGNGHWIGSYNLIGLGVSRECISVDDLGNIYVTRAGLTIKYDTSGNLAWAGTWGGEDIQVDSSGNVYVTRGSSGDYVTVKYYPNGDTAWLRKYNGPGNGIDHARAIAIDESLNIYVTGYSQGSGTNYDYATIKYFLNGDTSWIERYNGPGNGNDHASAIVVDESGNIYVTGKSFGSATDYDYLTIKYVQFLRGDANKDGKVSLSDIVYLINYLFKFGPAPDPIQSGDANCDGKVSLSDIVYLINYLFKFGPAPCI